MSEDVYRKLAEVLDTLPSGFPATEDGLEIKLLKKIFRPEDAELFCDLRMTFETAAQIAERTGRSLEGLDEHLSEMWERGQLFGVRFGDTKVFKMVPWAFGIFEFQLPHMDREMAEMMEEYGRVFGPQFFSNKPQLMQVIPIEKEIPARQEALPYEQVSHIIENGKDFSLHQCVCKKEQGLLGKPCDRSLDVCLAIAPVPGIFKDSDTARVISKQEAYDVLDRAEKNALVHLTWNMESGHFFICNCCGCCCGVLRAINEFGIPDATNSYYYAEIDPDKCTACGICKDERCQVNAVSETDGEYSVIKERCIGCGLCISTCPSEAVQLVRKRPEEIVPPPKNEAEWQDQRARLRGVDFSRYK